MDAGFGGENIRATDWFFEAKVGFPSTRPPSGKVVRVWWCRFYANGRIGPGVMLTPSQLLRAMHSRNAHRCR